MRIKSVLVLGMVFAAASVGVAQDMVEYSHAATKPPVALQGLANKINESLQKPAAQGSSGPQVQTIPTSKSAVTPETVAKPAPPAVFILTNGKQLESSHYMLTAENLIIQDGPNPHTIPLSALNREATTAANQKRGLNLKFPNSTSQMTISF